MSISKPVNSSTTLKSRPSHQSPLTFRGKLRSTAVFDKISPLTEEETPVVFDIHDLDEAQRNKSCLRR